MRLLLAALVLGLATPATAQRLTDTPEPARSTVYVEVLGNAGVASLNVDHLLSERAGLRVGGFVFPLPETDQERFREREFDGAVAAFFVAMGYRLVGPPSHALEIGLGLLAGASDDETFAFLPRAAVTATLGLRVQPAPGRVGLRVGLTPIFGRDRALWWPGFSVSYGLPEPRRSRPVR